jgi:hypothetical protein
VTMNLYEIALTLIILALIVICAETSSCLPGVSGTCGCCNLQELPKNFSFTDCNCTLKDPALSLCFNRTRSFPIYTQCYSFAECAITDIQVRVKHQIYSKVLYLNRLFLFIGIILV